MKRSLIASTIAATVAGIAITTTAFAEGPWDRHHDGVRHPIVWGVVMCLVVAAVIGLIVYLIVRRPSASTSSAQAASTSTTASAEAILAERLARGEVAPDDYRTLLAALKGESTPPQSDDSTSASAD